VTGTTPGPLPELPIRVRRGRPGDTRAVLDFTRATWDGWDYVPSVWHDWLEAPDGVLLVAVANASHQLDLFGRALTGERPVGIARIAMLSRDEAWLEGLRVDPGVRNRGVARLLHGACLVWARAQGATSVRYATGQENEGSHRLGTRHGFRLLRPWRSYQAPRDPHADDEDEDAHLEAADEDVFADLADDPGGQVPEDVAARATHSAADSTPGEDGRDGWSGGGRELDETGWGEEDDDAARAGSLSPTAARRRLHRAGLTLDPHASTGSVEAWWQRLLSDETFLAGERLYEFRSWAFRELDAGRFAAHVRAGEVAVGVAGRAPAVGDAASLPWGLAILPLGGPRFGGDRPWAAVVAGDGDEVLRLATGIRDELRTAIRLRVPDGAPVVAGHEPAFIAAGFPPADDTLHLLARHLAADDPIDVGAPGSVTFEEEPARVASAPDDPR
jgi:GNAT superfamily N-acetyltransferase